MIARLTVIIPAYNEEKPLGIFLPQVIEHCRQKGYSLVIVDDGSVDKTGQIIDQMVQEGAFKALHHKVNRGYGGAIKTGIWAAETEFVITIDADGQHRLEDIDKLYETIISQDADMVVGSRKGAKPAAIYRSIGKWIIRSFAKFLMPLSIYDINSGMKIYRTDLAKQYIHLCPDSMPYSDIITLIFIYQRHRVQEEPIVVAKRIAGSSTINMLTAFGTIMEILNMLVLFNPMRVFLPASLICILGGVLWGIPIVLKGRGISPGALLGILVGVIFFFLGLIAEQLSMLRKSGTQPPRKKL